MRRAIFAWVTVLVALAAALLPLPPRAVERIYSRGWFPAEQQILTRAGNLVPFSLFDVICLVVLIAFVLSTRRALYEGATRQAMAVILRRTVVGAAAIYLAFLVLWGFNYRRVPLQDKVAFDARRVTPRSAQLLAGQSITSLNRLYGAAHSGHPLTLGDLAVSFHRAQATLRDTRPIVPGRPKLTLLGGYFHQASIAGMTDPFLLETLLSPDLLEVERPFVTLHEWAHLAGYANEAEANFVAWIACMEGPPAAQYSAWFSLLGDLQPFLPRSGAPRLEIGPRIDVFAARYRYQGTSPLARAVARQSYDRYLKANRVPAGIESYDLVVQLILGTAVDREGRPQLR